MRWACHQSRLPQVIAPAPLWFAMVEVPIPGTLMVLSEYPSEYLLFATPWYDAPQLGPGERWPARQVAPDHVSCCGLARSIRIEQGRRGEPRACAKLRQYLRHAQ